MTTVAIRHRWCGFVSNPPQWILDYVDQGLWKGGLDCFRCQIYRPLGDFDLLQDQGREVGQGDAGHDAEPSHDGEPALTRVKTVPPSSRAKTTQEVEEDPR